MTTSYKDQIWLWDHNGCGDFFKVSSYKGSRWAIMFNHESERIPYCNDDHQLASGFDWINTYQLEYLKRSDNQFGSDITEIYQYVNVLGKTKWFTSPEIANGKWEWHWEEPYFEEDKKEYENLYNNLLKGKYPSLLFLHNLLRDDEVTALAFKVMTDIKKFIESETKNPEVELQKLLAKSKKK